MPYQEGKAQQETGFRGKKTKTIKAEKKLAIVLMETQYTEIVDQIY